MKQIPLTQGFFASVDDADFERVASYKWHALKQKRGTMACRMTGKKPNRKRIYMHRFILGVTASNLLVDHIDHNPLNNTRGNLRLATYAENRHNSRANNEPKTSKYLGVYYYKRDQKFIAVLAINGKQKKVGRSKDEDKAALMYNEAAKKYYGEFANLNSIKARESLNHK